MHHKTWVRVRDTHSHTCHFKLLLKVIAQPQRTLWCHKGPGEWQPPHPGGGPSLGDLHAAVSVSLSTCGRSNKALGQGAAGGSKERAQYAALWGHIVLPSTEILDKNNRTWKIAIKRFARRREECWLEPKMALPCALALTVFKPPAIFFSTLLSSCQSRWRVTASGDQAKYCFCDAV